MSSNADGHVTPQSAAAVYVQLPLPIEVTITGFLVQPGTDTSGPVAYYTANDGIVRSWDMSLKSHGQVGCDEWPQRSGMVLAPGSRAVSQVDKDTLALWRLETGEVERIFVVPPNSGSGWRYHLNEWDVDAYGRLVASARDKHVRIWDVDSGLLLHDMRRLDDPFFSNNFTVAWLDTDHVLTWEERGTIRLWNVSAGAVVESWEAPEMGQLKVAGTGRLVHLTRGQLAIIVRGRSRRKKLSGAARVRQFCVVDMARVVTVSERGVEHWDIDSARLLSILPIGLPSWFQSSDPWDPPTFLSPVTNDLVVSVGVTGAGALWFPHRFGVTAEKSTESSAPAVTAKPDEPSLAMNRTTFWSLVETSRRRAQRAGAADVDVAQVHALVELLISRRPEEIIAFDQHFRDRLAEADTDGLLYAATDELDGISDDGFLYFRCWLVGLGRRSFAIVVDNPARLTRLLRRHKSDDPGNFDLFCATNNAWEQKFNEEFPTTLGD